MIAETLHWKKYCFLLMMVIITGPFVSAQNFAIGYLTTTFIDASRNNRAVEVEIYYPADTAGDNVPVALAGGASFSVLAFGHGFVMGWNAYENIWTSLVPQGFLMVFPKTEGGIAPAHLEFGKDLAFAIGAIKNLGQTQSSIFYQKVAETSAVMGHSMGGGAAFLAAQIDANITALVTLAPAETNPSAIAAAGNLSIPALIFAGANDCVTPPASNQLPMFEAMPSDCKTYVSINGASHCQMANSNFLCQLGEATCSPSATISREVQHAVLNSYLGIWLKSQLESDCEAGDAFDTLLESDAAVSYVKDCTFCTPLAVAEVFPSDSGQIYPNPFDTEIFVESVFGQPLELTVYDAFSRVIIKKTIDGKTQFDTSVLASGVYYYTLTNSASSTKKGKLVKR